MSYNLFADIDNTPDEPPVRPPRAGAPPVGPIDLRALSDGSDGGYEREEDDNEFVDYVPNRYIYHIHGEGRIVLWKWNWWGELCRRFLLPAREWIRTQQTLTVDRIMFEVKQGEVILTTIDGKKVPYTREGYGWYAAPPYVEVERRVIPVPDTPGGLAMFGALTTFVLVRLTDLPPLHNVPTKKEPTREEVRKEADSELRCVYVDMEAQGLVKGQAPRLQLRGYVTDNRNCHGMRAEEISIEAGCCEA